MNHSSFQALVEYFGTLSKEWALECLKELLVVNPQANLQLVVNIAREYTDQLGSAKIVALLEAKECWPGMYLYLGGRLATSEVRVWGGGWGGFREVGHCRVWA